MTYKTREDRLAERCRANSRHNKKWRKTKKKLARSKRSHTPVSQQERETWDHLARMGTVGYGRARPKRDKGPRTPARVWRQIWAVVGRGPWKPNTDLQLLAGAARRKARFEVVPLSEGDCNEEWARNAQATRKGGPAWKKTPQDKSYGKGLDFEDSARMNADFASRFDS